LHEDRYGPWNEPGQPDTAPAGDGDAGRFTVRSLARVHALATSGAPGVSGEQQRRRARHRIMRILLDDPVLYLDRLTADERTYLQQTIASISGWTAEAGLVVERRAEGWAAIDPDHAATDVRFPEGNDLAKFAALVLLAALQPDHTPLGLVRHARATADAVLADRLRANPGWARAYQDDGGAARLTDAALDLLVRLDLATVDRTGVTLLPAAGRYRPTVADTTPVRPAPDTDPHPATSDQPSLLDPDSAEEV
jgi:uncharacterized protein (TIGR02678 family)